MNSDLRFKAKPEVMDADIGGDRVLLHMEKNTYFTLNPTAVELWLALSEPKAFDQLVEMVTQKFDVSAERCRPDIEAILSLMLEADVIDRVPG